MEEAKASGSTGTSRVQLSEKRPEIWHDVQGPYVTEEGKRYFRFFVYGGQDSLGSPFAVEVPGKEIPPKVWSPLIASIQKGDTSKKEDRV